MYEGKPMSQLPTQFAALEKIWGEWIIDNEPARAKLRSAKSTEELVEFHDAMLPHVKDMIAYIDQYPLDKLPTDATNLWWLVSSFIGVAMAVEMYGSHEGIPGGYLLADVKFINSANALTLLH
jgi:hypothetical protein